MGEVKAKADRITKLVEDIPHELVGQVIGPAGRHMLEIKEKSKCTLVFVAANTVDPSAPAGKQVCSIRGLPHDVPYAEQLLREKVNEAIQRSSRHKGTQDKQDSSWSNDQSWSQNSSWSNGQSWSNQSS